MTSILPQCFGCLFLNREAAPAGSVQLRCIAFPKGIPDAILLNQHDHTKPYAGDNGITFEPVEEPEETK